MREVKVTTRGIPSQPRSAYHTGQKAVVSASNGIMPDLSVYMLLSRWLENFEEKTDANGVSYLLAKKSIVTVGTLTQYATDGVSVPSIWEGIPFDNQTIWLNPETKKVEVIGGTGSDFDASAMWAVLAGNTDEQINKSHLTTALSEYATTESVSTLQSEITKKWTQDDAKIKNWDTAFGWGDHKKAGYAHLAGEETFTGLKHFTAGLSVGPGKHKLYEKDGVVYFEGDLAVTGGITQYATDGVSVSTIMDGVTADEVTITKGTDNVLRIKNAGSGSSFDKAAMWAALAANTTEPIHKSHLTTALQGYATEEWVTAKNYAVKSTTLAGYGITDAYTKTESDNKYPTKTGAGASGTWNISVSGSAKYVRGFRSLNMAVSGSSAAESYDGGTGFSQWAFGTTRNTSYGYLSVLKPSVNDTLGLSAHGTIIVAGTGDTHMFFGVNYGNALFRIGGGNADKILWQKTVAFTDSNVASATKLQTPRSLWGNMFDGTANISGDITLAFGKGIYLSANDERWLLQTKRSDNTQINGIKTNGFHMCTYFGDTKTMQFNNDRIYSYVDFRAEKDLYINGIRLYKSADGTLKLEGNLLVTGGITQYSTEESGGGSGGGGIDAELLWEILGGSGTQQINKSHLTDALKGYLTSVSLSTISDLHSSWGALLKAAPSGYVTRWPSISEVTNKQSLVVKLNSGTTEGTNMFTYNATAAKSINITAGAVGAYTKSEADDKYLLKTSYTAADILAKLKTVDGAGSGLDADLLDGIHANGLFTNLSYAKSVLSVTIGGTKKDVNITASYPSISNITMNTIASYGNCMGMASLSSSNSNVNPNNQTSWHHFINMSYTTDTANMWQSQIAIKAGTTEVWVRSRNGGTISDSTPWVAPWVRLARITDNVASATKLKTPHTLWGHSFDGTKDISGALTNASGLASNWTDVWDDGNNKHPWYGYDHTHPNNGIYSTTISDYYGMCLKTRDESSIVLLTGKVGIGTTTPSYKLQVSGTLRATDATLSSLFVNTGDPTLKVYSGKATDGINDGSICFQTSIDGTDGQTHGYPAQYQNRCNIVLQPRGGQVYIGTNPTNPSSKYKLNVNGSSLTTDLYINGIHLYKSADGTLKLDGNLLVTGGITQYSTTESGGGSGGGGIDAELLWEILGGTGTQQINKSHLTDALKGYLTSVNLETISDLHSSWDALLKAAPSAYITRHPTISEVTNKQNLTIQLNGGTTEGTNKFTYNATAAKTINITASSVGAPTKTGSGASGTWAIGISGNAATASKWATARTITLGSYLSGSVSLDGSANVTLNANVIGLTSQGNKTAISGTTVPSSGVRLYQVYNNGYPTTYGNLLSVKGGGAGELLLAWKNTNRIYYRSKSDVSTEEWQSWSTVAFITDNVASASKLQTPRTLWGRSFDGTNNVTGTLNNVSGINFTGDAPFNFDANANLRATSTSDNTYWHIDRYDGSQIIKILSSSGKMLLNHVEGVNFHNEGASCLDQNGNIKMTINNLNYYWCILGLDGVPLFVANSNTKNIGLGTDKPSQKLHVVGGTKLEGNVFFKNDGFKIDDYGNMEATVNSESYYWGVKKIDGNSAFCVTAVNGNVGINITNPSQKLHVNGNILSTGGITQYSDQRAKTIIEQITLSLKDIAQSPAIRFKWNGWKQQDDGKTHIGGIAQYVQRILPEAIYNTDGAFTMDYAITGYIFAVNTAKNLLSYESKTDKEIKQLKKRVKYLEKQLKKLGYEDEQIIS